MKRTKWAALIVMTIVLATGAFALLLVVTNKNKVDALEGVSASSRIRIIAPGHPVRTLSAEHVPSLLRAIREHSRPGCNPIAIFLERLRHRHQPAPAPLAEKGFAAARRFEGYTLVEIVPMDERGRCTGMAVRWYQKDDIAAVLIGNALQVRNVSCDALVESSFGK